METVTSRQNRRLQHLRELSRNAELRRKERLYVCDGDKLLQEALRSGVQIKTVFWKGGRPDGLPAFQDEVLLTEALFDYASPLKSSPGPLFTVRMPESDRNTAADADSPETGMSAAAPEPLASVLVLEGVQDPGNVGTVLRTADAFGTDAVVLLEGCADLYAPKTVRASMGAVFRQTVLQMKLEELPAFCRGQGLPLYAAALSENARDIREVPLRHAAVCIGSEGSGLSRELRALCSGEVIIPMRGAAESLNAAVAASILMWEMTR